MSCSQCSITKSSIQVLAAAAAIALVAGAANGSVSLTYTNFDTRTQGHFEPVATPSNDADGSMLMQTYDNTSQGKVSVLWYQPSAQPLGTLGDLNALTVDFLKASAPITPAPNQFAYRINLGTSGGQTLALVWENNYNGNSTVPTDTWQNDFSLLGGNFWERGNGANFNGGSQAVPISSWLAGHTESMDGNGAAVNSVPLNAITPVYALEIAYGSGVGAFTGYVDDIQLGFAGTNPESYVGNVAIPEPATVTVLGLVSTMLLMRRPRRA